jgi:hypothetical protein
MIDIAGMPPNKVNFVVPYVLRQGVFVLGSK